MATITKWIYKEICIYIWKHNHFLEISFSLRSISSRGKKLIHLVHWCDDRPLKWERKTVNYSIKCTKRDNSQYKTLWTTAEHNKFVIINTTSNVHSFRKSPVTDWPPLWTLTSLMFITLSRNALFGVSLALPICSG